MFPRRPISEVTTSADQPVAGRRRDVLTWAGLDPESHPFVWSEDEEIRVTALVVPLVPTGEDVGWQAKHRCVNQVTELFVGRYGAWAADWNWSIGEGDKDGGVVGAWCCSSHSVGSPEETAAKAVASLVEWRAWLEGLAAVFAELAPDPDASPEQRSWHLERAAVRLVTRVLDRGGADSGWYGACYLVLQWFLTSCGMDRAEAMAVVADAIGGRFESWVAPDRTLIDSVGEDLAVGVTGKRPYRDHREYGHLEDRHDRGRRDRR
ncbi:hypothetical protein ACIRJR_03280 [Streptomyces sp. NPDC102402]|uniref:hypothetical protein n=1 Tax=Streptomyces sp. NPDC102402 TaxID=3366169 RepID=UPI003800FDEF